MSSHFSLPEVTISVFSKRIHKTKFSKGWDVFALERGDRYQRGSHTHRAKINRQINVHNTQQTWRKLKPKLQWSPALHMASIVMLRFYKPGKN